jgi:hypothetical protein
MFPSDSRPLTITRPSLISASVIIVGPRDEADLAQAQRLVRGIGELLLSFRWLQSDRLSSSHNHIKGVVNTCQFLRRKSARCVPWLRSVSQAINADLAFPCFDFSYFPLHTSL